MQQQPIYLHGLDLIMVTINSMALEGSSTHTVPFKAI